MVGSTVFPVDSLGRNTSLISMLAPDTVRAAKRSRSTRQVLGVDGAVEERVVPRSSVAILAATSVAVAPRKRGSLVRARQVYAAPVVIRTHGVRFASVATEGGALISVVDSVGSARSYEIWVVVSVPVDINRRLGRGPSPAKKRRARGVARLLQRGTVGEKIKGDTGQTSSHSRDSPP